MGGIGMQRIYLVLIGTLLCVPAIADQQPPLTSTSGKHLYQQMCAACHGSQFDGKGPIARAVFPAPANLKEHVGKHSFMEIMHPIMHGEGAMPAWGETLSHDEAFSIAEYLQSQIK
jgi:mono/diheme cytochrome c family protein